MKRKTSRFYALCQTKRINYLMLLQYHQQSELYPEYLYNLMICNLFFFTGFRIHTNTQIHIKNWIRVSSGFYLSFFSRHGANAWCAICRPQNLSTIYIYMHRRHENICEFYTSARLNQKDAAALEGDPICLYICHTAATRWW